MNAIKEICKSKKCKHIIPLVADWQVPVKEPPCLYLDNEDCHNPDRKGESDPCPFDEWAEKHGHHYTRRDANVHGDIVAHD